MVKLYSRLLIQYCLRPTQWLSILLLMAALPMEQLISEPDDGIYDALNKGILHSSGDIVGFLHADDLFESRDTLENIANAFDIPGVEAVYGDLVYVRKNDTSKIVRYWKSCAFNEKLLDKELDATASNSLSKAISLRKIGNVQYTISYSG